MGIVLFGPAVALNAVTGFPTWAVIILIGAVCIVYTTLGGMKAVIWTDVFQTFIMLAGMLAVVIQGTIAVGGLGKVWAIAEAGGRIEFFDFDPDPTVRHTFWTLVVGSLFVWMPPYTIDQQMIQRFSSTRSLQQAIWALLLNVPGMFVIITLCSLSGLVMYAYYADCDPIDRGTVHDPNQGPKLVPLLPRFVMDVLGFVPGLPGLFVASLFSGAFSSVSSMLNSLAAVTWEDFLKLSPKMRRLPDKQATYVNKGLVVVFAVLGVAMAFVFSLVGGTVLQMSMAFNGAAGAPLVGIFLLGVFFPCANWIGVVVGGALGCALPMWISVGAYVTKPPVMRNLPRSIAGCLNSSDVTTASLLSTVVSTLEPFTSEPMTLPPSSSDDTLPLYTLSYLWYTATGIVVTLTVGLAVSVLTNRFVAVSVEPGLMISFVDRFCCCFPLTWRERTRCGIQLLKHEKGAETAEESTGPGSAVVLPSQPWSFHLSRGPSISAVVLPSQLWSFHLSCGPSISAVVLPSQLWSFHLSRGPSISAVVLPSQLWSFHLSCGPPIFLWPDPVSDVGVTRVGQRRSVSGTVFIVNIVTAAFLDYLGNHGKLVCKSCVCVSQDGASIAGRRWWYGCLSVR
ncbi:Sodium-coupled monocarboxylate transporter 1 [Lamellibrachia satsuma]|nr:Sodium-coupled monocarboxylate transporter 1 [Lamellibrachia satsuma]